MRRGRLPPPRHPVCFWRACQSFDECNIFTESISERKKKKKKNKNREIQIISSLATLASIECSGKFILHIFT